MLDEPTPFLPRADVDRLFTLVRRVVANGASVIFVSHDIDEVLEITDRATVLRDGRVAGVMRTSEATRDSVVGMIVGRQLQTGAIEGRCDRWCLGRGHYRRTCRVARWRRFPWRFVAERLWG